jgi:hypothetical protein
MKSIFVAALFTAAFASVAHSAGPLPCEKMLDQVRATLKDAKLSDADKAAVADLQGKGTERCKADDDAGADKFFADALKLMGK